MNSGQIYKKTRYLIFVGEPYYTMENKEERVVPVTIVHTPINLHKAKPKSHCQVLLFL